MNQRAIQSSYKKYTGSKHSLFKQKIQFPLKISIIMNLRVIQCPCKKHTSYLLSAIWQCTVVTIFSAMHIPGIFCVRIKNAEWLMWDNDTLRNDIPDIIIHYLYEQFTLDQKKLRILAGKWCVQERWIEVSLH